MSRYGFWGFKPQPTVWERKEKAAKTITRIRSFLEKIERLETECGK